MQSVLANFAKLVSTTLRKPCLSIPTWFPKQSKHQFKPRDGEDVAHQPLSVCPPVIPNGWVVRCLSFELCSQHFYVAVGLQNATSRGWLVMASQHYKKGPSRQFTVRLCRLCSSFWQLLNLAKYYLSIRKHFRQISHSFPTYCTHCFAPRKHYLKSLNCPHGPIRTLPPVFLGHGSH